MHDSDQFFRCEFGGNLIIGIEHVVADMVLDYFSDETLKGTAARGCLLQDFCAARILFECALQRLELAADAIEALHKLRFLVICV